MGCYQERLSTLRRIVKHVTRISDRHVLGGSVQLAKRPMSARLRGDGRDVGGRRLPDRQAFEVEAQRIVPDLPGVPSEWAHAAALSGRAVAHIGARWEGPDLVVR